MDLVTCEAPLDNSFQKDRRELVNKGSLGRRRKPSRSNLRLILSPANDRQDIDLFHSHTDSNGSFIQEKTPSANNVGESPLQNHPESFGHRANSNINHNGSENSHLTAASTNYREVVESINHIYSVKCIDLNGNRPGLTSRNYPDTTGSTTNHEAVVKSRQQKSDKNSVNSKYHSQISVTRNQQNVNARNYQDNSKFCSIQADRSNNYHGVVVSKGQRGSEPNNKPQVLKISNQQQTVKSKNQQNIVTFSNHRQIITSTPVQSKKSAVPNGNRHELTQDCSSKLYIESSLPRTSKEPNLVADAQQFSIEAKLRRKKSEVQGRSAVLIQTWERRTLSESYSKLRRDSKTALKNRFSGKENSDANSTAMPDSYICIKYKGSLQNGGILQRGELVPSVRGGSPDETMVYRITEDRHRRPQGLQQSTNGCLTVNGNSAVHEPEWISLSRKLCAKFVEGHIEPHSPDSYPHEEPEGVGEEAMPSPQPKTHSDTTTPAQTESQKWKVIPVALNEESASNSEPPWIHLSRKLCNKFIEEHIEYPPITNGHFVEVPELIEPNGDVRIIEKVGKPKGHKSKQKKETEPEWVSLSKRLRAKFIESHIDDPDTIALDNQLNASDPEENGSETLSDVSHDVSVPKDTSVHPAPVECKNFSVRTQLTERESTFQESKNKPSQNDVIFPDKECCWEYQEMEFDQESNSGTFQEPEYYDEPLQEVRAHRGSLPQDGTRRFAEEVSCSMNQNSSYIQNAECYNNDVKFAPYFGNDEPVPESPQQNKLITVQFIAHAGNNQPAEENILHSSKTSKSGSFFNLSTWDEAHYKQDIDDRQSPEEMPLSKNFRSKSVDNLCDSLEDRPLVKVEDFEEKEKRNSSLNEDNFGSEHILINSEGSSNKEKDEIYLHEFKLDPGSSSDVSSMKESANCTSEGMVSESESRVLSANSFHRHEKKQNIPHHTQSVESSSEDEVFEYVPRNKKYSPEAHYGKISVVTSPVLDKEKRADQKQVQNEKVKNDHASKNGKNIKCNGMIPNSVYDGFPEHRTSPSKHNQNESSSRNAPKEPVKLGMSKWITMSKSEQNVTKPEYCNLQSAIQRETNVAAKSSGTESESKKNRLKKINNANQNSTESKTSSSSKNIPPKNSRTKYESDYASDFAKTDGNSNSFNEFPAESDLKSKCKSLCDISFNSNSLSNESGFKHHESVADLCSSRRTPPQIEFQHFQFDSEIPLCAKLVSKHDKKLHSKNIHSSYPGDRSESPCPSESSHVYEDMFKETPSGPSDSEASSWTIMKNNTYYVNGRSSSMNDLDFSDSCSMSVKCDYASSSENSTLQSRHSSYASSSFYVNLRDYDSHMLEPSLDKGKKNNGRMANNGNASNVSKSNPPTPESLRHLFTSPLNSIHLPPNRTPRLLNRMPSDPQSHYYSTAAATSSAFKHGFSLTPPKPKKTERSSSIKIKDIAHGIILTFKRFQNHSKNSTVPPTQHVDVSHLAEMKSNSELGKSSKSQKNSKKQSQDKGQWAENGKTDTDSGFLSDVQRAKARRSSSDLTGLKSNSELFNSDKKKSKSSKKNSNRDKGKKSRSKTEPKAVPTVSRKVQQMADGTLYLVTTVSGDTALPGVYSDSPDTSSELSTHQPVKATGESNC